MKRITSALLLLLTCALLLNSCFLPQGFGVQETTSADDSDNIPQREPDKTPNNDDSNPDPEPEPVPDPDPDPNPNPNPDPDPNPNPDPDVPQHLFTDFTDEQKSIWMQYIGTVIPFIPNDEYVFEGYYDIDDFENGIYFSTAGNTMSSNFGDS